MQVNIEPQKSRPGCFTIIPYGSIDSETHHEFREQINKVLSQNPKIILMDMRHVDTITSAGLGVLFSIKKLLISNHGELLFCNLQPQISKLFEIVKTLPRDTVFKSIEEADAYFMKIMKEEILKEQARKNKN